MTKVTQFPRYKLSDVAASLRLFADKLDSGEEPAVVRCVVALERADGTGGYKAFGSEPFTRAHAAGLLLETQLAVLEYKRGEDE